MQSAVLLTSELKCTREYQKCWGLARDVLSEKLRVTRLRGYTKGHTF